MAMIHVVYDFVNDEPVVAFENEKDAYAYMEKEIAESDGYLDPDSARIYSIELVKHRRKKKCQKRKSRKKR